MKIDEKLESAPKKLWKAVSFEKKDLPSIGLYFKKHFRATSQYGSMGIFQWRAVDNYLMPGIINLIKDEDKIVSTLSNTPKKILAKGKEYLVAEIGDANTDPAYQRQGMLSLLINQSTQDALSRGFSGVYSTPSTVTPSLPAFINKANFLPQQDLRIKGLVFPLDISFLIQKRVHWLISRYVGSLSLTLIYLYYLAKKVFHPTTAILFEEVHVLPNGWDIFWEKAKQHYDFIFERNRQSLVWRFFENPNKYRFHIAKENDVIIGYMVYRIVTDEDIKRLVIADFLFIPGYEFCFNTFLLKAFQKAFNVGANSISVWCVEGCTYYQLLKRFGFIVNSDVLLVWFQNEFSSSLKEGSWHFTMSDSDNI